MDTIFTVDFNGFSFGLVNLTFQYSRFLLLSAKRLKIISGEGEHIFNKTKILILSLNLVNQVLSFTIVKWILTDQFNSRLDLSSYKHKMEGEVLIIKKNMRCYLPKMCFLSASSCQNVSDAFIMLPACFIYFREISVEGKIRLKLWVEATLRVLPPPYSTKFAQFEGKWRLKYGGWKGAANWKKNIAKAFSFFYLFYLQKSLIDIYFRWIYLSTQWTKW